MSQCFTVLRFLCYRLLQLVTSRLTNIYVPLHCSDCTGRIYADDFSMKKRGFSARVCRFLTVQNTVDSINLPSKFRQKAV